MNSIVEMLMEKKEYIGTKLCFIDRKHRYTYNDIYNQTICFANKLKKLGVNRGDCVLIQANQEASFMSAVLAIHLLGARSVPYEHKCPISRINELIDITSAKIYISQKELELSAKWLNFDDEYTDDVTAFETFDLPEKEEIADILFTTGTTGKSKGVMISHGAICGAVENLKGCVSLQENDITLVCTPVNHTHALRRLYVTIMTGATTVISDGIANVLRFYDSLSNERITGFYLMPAMLSTLFQLSGEKLGEYKKQIRFVELGSSPLNQETRETLFRLLPESEFIFDYGSTESGCSCGYDMNKEGFRPFCIGRPNINASFEFVNEDGQTFEATENNPGFIVSIGTMNMTGYYKELELTKEVLYDGKVKSNDLGYMDSEGYIYFLGRKGDIINSGGIKISTLEIEDVALKHESVLECACVPKEDINLGEVPKLYVVPKNRDEFDLDIFGRYLKQAIELSKYPRYIEIIDELPKTFNGKIIKRGL